jgi:hypothetical protein
MVEWAIGVAANNAQTPQTMWSWSAYGGDLSAPRHVSFTEPWTNMWVPNPTIPVVANEQWAYTQASWTSLSTPIFAGAAATYKMFFPNHTKTQIIESFANTAYDITSTWVGYDNRSGYGMVDLSKAVIWGSSISLPSVVDAGSNGSFSFQFTPETLNDPTLSSQTLLYPNGLPVPYTIGSDGKRVYTITVNTNNGFVNWSNHLTYTVAAPAPNAGCTLSGNTKSITVSNIWTLSTNEFEQQEPSVLIAPNPVNDILTFTSNKTIKKAEVYTVEGKLLDHDMNVSDNKIDMSHIAEWIVFVILVADDGTHTTQKVVVKH